MTERDYQTDYYLPPKRRRRGSEHRRGIGRLFFQVILFLAIIEALWLLIANLSVKPIVAQWGVIEKGCWAEALFLRNETIVSVPSDGRFIVKTPAGTRVPRGEILACIQPKDSGDAVSDNNLESEHLRQLKLIQKLSRDNEELKSDLKRMTDQMERDLAKKKQNGAEKTNEELTAFLKEKNRILRTIQDNEDQARRLNLAGGSLPGDALLITADQPGYWYPELDGWEQKMNPDNFHRLRPGEIQAKYPLKEPGSIVTAGTVCGKIISPFSQMIAVIVDPRQTGAMNPEDSWKIVIDEKSFPVVLKDKIKLPDGKMILGLEDTTMKICQPNRRTRVYVIYQRTTGITLPVQALFKKGKTTYVKRIEGVGYKAVNVKVLADDGERAVVQGIDFGTTVFSR